MKRTTLHRALAAALGTALVATGAIGVGGGTADAWIAGVRQSKPTAEQRRTGGIDTRRSTHQWLASQAMVILAADGHGQVARFLASPDPSAPGAPAGADGPHTFAWRLLKGVDDADGPLYPQLPDHLHNHWTHRGRKYIVGGSAASGAEKASATAISAWRAGDRGTAIYWLGAALHLVQDACVPQHGWFGISPYHSDYERWVRRNQASLAVADSGIYRTDFRVRGGHGGEDWSSAHPRGWADECAHRAFKNLAPASHPLPKRSSPTDPQWATAPHVADTQRLSAGFIVDFFDRVGGPS